MNVVPVQLLTIEALGRLLFIYLLINVLFKLYTLVTINSLCSIITDNSQQFRCISFAFKLLKGMG